MNMLSLTLWFMKTNTSQMEVLFDYIAPYIH